MSFSEMNPLIGYPIPSGQPSNYIHISNTKWVQLICNNSNQRKIGYEFKKGWGIERFGGEKEGNDILLKIKK